MVGCQVVRENKGFRSRILDRRENEEFHRPGLEKGGRKKHPSLGIQRKSDEDVFSTYSTISPSRDCIALNAVNINNAGITRA